MEWLTSIRTAIDYMEEHLTDNISAQDVADRVYLSPFFLQKGFSLMTGYGIGHFGTAMKRRRALRKLFPGSMAQRHHRCAVERQSTHSFP